jgi:hypothetical protein
MTATYERIATQTLSSTASSISFTSIPQTYTDLIMIAELRSSDSRNGGQSVNFRFNGDSSSNYSKTGMYSVGSSRASFRQTSASVIELSCVMNGSASGLFSQNIVNIMNYSNTSIFKTVPFRVNTEGYTSVEIGLYRSTSAITSITITEPSALNWVAGSSVTIYGIKAE